MSSLPAPLLAAVTAALRDLGDVGPLERILPVGGGCIHHVFCLETAHQSYLLKWNSGALAATFPSEADGLRLLRSANAIRVPAPLAQVDVPGTQTAFLLIEWIDSPPGGRAPDMSQLGEELADLHHSRPAADAAAYGLERDNFIGATPQRNGWNTDWLRFYTERRLEPQIELAGRNGRLPAARRQRLERLVAHLDQWLGGVARQPALLHGDLWGGNLLAGPHGEPVLIDPAVYYGDREAELAYTELFGGFSFQFYQAYKAAWPLEPGYAERRDLYNLYHLLNHLNLFGESYGYEVDAVCRKYVG